MDEQIPLPEDEEEEPSPKPHWEPVPPPSTEYGPFDAYQPPPVDRTNRTAIIIIGIACGCIVILVAIGIISAISIPILLSAREGAVNEKARNAARTVLTAEFAYYSANKRYATLQELSQGRYLDERYAHDPVDLGNGVTATLTLKPDDAGFQVEVTGKDSSYVGDESGEITER
jgi:type II secretory pathway pseudopilin PulG